MPLDVTKAGSAPVAAVAGERQTQTLRGLNILCIDNEPKILEGMRLLISGWGCEVQSLASLAEVADFHSAAPDLVIADYHLDDGTGIAAILDLRQRFGAELPALLLTADRTLEIRAEAERYGIAVQHKPVRPAALRAFITQISGQKRAAAE